MTALSVYVPAVCLLDQFYDECILDFRVGAVPTLSLVIVRKHFCRIAREMRQVGDAVEVPKPLSAAAAKNSIDALLKNIELVRAAKRKNANALVRSTIPAGRRHPFELPELLVPQNLPCREHLKRSFGCFRTVLR